LIRTYKRKAPYRLWSHDIMKCVVNGVIRNVSIGTATELLKIPNTFLQKAFKSLAYDKISQNYTIAEKSTKRSDHPKVF
jgi:hypothetical protein